MIQDYLSDCYVKQHLITSVNDVRELVYTGQARASLDTFLNELEERINKEFD